MAAELVVDVEMVPSLQPDAVGPVATAAAAVLRAGAAGAAAAGTHPNHPGCGVAHKAVADAFAARDAVAGAHRDMVDVTAAGTAGLAGVYA